MKRKFVIAIDGPAASGKSTTARALAKYMGYIYIDTGAMYRACALCSLEQNISLTDIVGLEKMLDTIDIKITYSVQGNKIFLNGKDISLRIREADITKISSEIAVIGIVRTKMVELQQEIAKDGAVIMDGRDIGTVVLPNADYKFFMIADVKVRAKRRWLESKEKANNFTLEEVEKELIWRDKNDSSRKISPLKQAVDAVAIDTTNMSIMEQVEFLENYMNENRKN